MKKLFLIGLLFLMGCYEHIPEGVRAQMASEDYLDSLYRPDTVEDKIGVGYITLKGYLTPSPQRRFQQDTDHYHSPKIDWTDFTKKVNYILSKEDGHKNGVIAVENYRINDTEYTTAFFMDSTFKKVFATIQMK